MIEMAVVGGGPAGIAAAIQCQRSGISVTLFEKDRIGGLIKEANLVENYLGFPGGIPGQKLCDRFEEQLRFHNIRTLQEEVMLVDHDGFHFILHTALDTYKAERLVLATGTLPAAARLGFGVDNRTVCDNVMTLAHASDLSIAVLGAGDAAYDYALRLAKRNDVTIISRGEPRCLPLLRERALADDRISFLEGRTVQAVRKLQDGVSLKLKAQSGQEEMLFDRLLIAIGRVPNLTILGPSMEESSESLMNNGLFYMAGDVVNGDRRQVSIAASDGIKVAMSVREAAGR